VIAKHPKPLSDVVFIREAHPALTCRQDLSRMKTQTRHLSEAAARATREAASKRARRIFDDGQRPERLTDLFGARWVAELVDHDCRSRVAVSRFAQRFGGTVPLVRIDVDKPHLRPRDSNSVGRARPTQGRAQHLISRSDLERFE